MDRTLKLAQKELAAVQKNNKHLIKAADAVKPASDNVVKQQKALDGCKKNVINAKERVKSAAKTLRTARQSNTGISSATSKYNNAINSLRSVIREKNLCSRKLTNAQLQETTAKLNLNAEAAERGTTPEKAVNEINLLQKRANELLKKKSTLTKDVSTQTKQVAIAKSKKTGASKAVNSAQRKVKSLKKKQKTALSRAKKAGATGSKALTYKLAILAKDTKRLRADVSSRMKTTTPTKTRRLSNPMARKSKVPTTDVKHQPSPGTQLKH